MQDWAQMNRVINNMLFIAVGWPDVWDCKAFLSTLPSSHTRRQCPAIWLAVVYNSERCLRNVLLEEMIHPCMFPEIQIQEYNSCCNRYWSRKHELYTDNTSTIKKTLPSIYAYSSLVGCKCISFMNDQSFFLSAHYAPQRCYILKWTWKYFSCFIWTEMERVPSAHCIWVDLNLHWLTIIHKTF